MTDLKNIKFVMDFQIHHYFFLAYPPHPSASTLLYSTYHPHLVCLFNTDDNPVTKNSSSQLSPNSSGQRLRQEDEEGESQPFSIWKILSAGCWQPLLC